MEDRTLLSTITVTSAGDTIDAGDGVVTLREAITAANTNATSGDAPAGTVGLDTIAFNIPGAGLHTITLASALPAITDPVVIDGMTQPGSSPNTLAVGDNAVLNIEINGANIAFNFAGLQINAGASGSTIRGLVINRFTAGGSAAINLFNSADNTIVGNFLGTDPTGVTAQGNNIGVQISGENNKVGSAAPADRNVISGNGNGVSLTNTGSALNTVQGNYIGVSAAGNVDLGNTNTGVLIRGVFNGATQGGTLIGGATSAPGTEAGNVISGNDGLAGIKFDNLAQTVLGPVTIQGNIIGLGADGTTVVGNTGAGIQALTDLTSTNGAVLIGGPNSSTRNIISGNKEDGITYSDAVATVQGNYIGTDATGTLDRGNTAYGIAILGDRRDVNDPTKTTMTIGGASAGEGNLISGNDLGGVSIRNANVVIQGNRIGTQADGTSPLGNTGEGVKVYNVLAAPALQIPVGGAADGAGNVIAYNNVGITVRDTVVTILRNSFFGNLSDGIVLSAAAFANAPPPPVLTGATASTITGTLAGPPNTLLRLEFFATPNENNEGKTFLGTMDVTTDAAGAGSFSFNPVGGVLAGQSLTATATSTLGTSRFSAAIVLPTEGAADVGVSIVPLPNPVSAGGDLTYTITVVNAGPAAALDVALSNAIPANTTFVSFAAPAGWTNSTPAVGATGTVAANIASLPVGSVVFTLIVRVDPATAAGTTITNTANVSATNDSNPSDDSATATVSVSQATPPAQGVADLAVTMTASDGPLIVGDNFTYTITARNNGPDPAAGVVLTDVLPAGLSFVSSNLAVQDSSSRTLTTNIGDLAPGATATWTLVVQASAVGSYTNVAQVQGLQTDPDPANNTASRTDAVAAPPPVIVGPQIVSVIRDGFHWQPTSIVVTFNADMDPARAQNVDNYRIQAPGGRLVPVGSATYNAVGRSVTIHPVHRLNIHYPFRLTINGQSPDGLTDASGNLLDGAANGQSGTDYQANVLWYGAHTRVTPVHSGSSQTSRRAPLRPIHRAPLSTHAAPRFARAAHAPAPLRLR